MLVYRVCSKDEVDKIFQGEDFSLIGCSGEKFLEYQSEKDINNHKYDKGKLYLHFFDDIWSIVYWRAFKGNYVCTYDIPDDILSDCHGSGKYLNLASESENRTLVSEYAIESSRIKKEYLVRVELIKEDLYFSDDDYPEELDEFLETIFERETRKEPYRMKHISEEDIMKLLRELRGKNEE